MEVEVELVNVSKSFGPITAVRNVTLRIEKNEFFSILGPSGCGKTTLLRILAGLEDPDDGVVKIGGRVVNDVPPHKRGVGLVFQGTAVFPHMNVFDNIAFGLKMRGYKRSEIKEKVESVLRVMNMSPEVYAKKRVDQLSGGERQRVEIARSLVLEPQVLLLDEPLGPLDLKIRQKMQLELKRLQKVVGTTFVYVTHDQTEALAMSDRIAVMNRGEILQVGTPEEIYMRPVNKFVADFIGESNLIEGRVSEDGLFLAEGLPPIIIPNVGDAPRPGEKAILSVRPEMIEIGEFHGLENKLVGEVVDKTYAGSYAVLRVKVTDRWTLTTYVRKPELSKNVRVGERVTIGWRASDAYLITNLG